MKVVLFCGGLGMRMRDGVTSGPKPMAMVGERPLLWHVMRYYAHFGHTDFVLCLGYGASAVKDFFLNYDETRSNDFVLENGAREVKLFSTDISDWRITFVDTGLNSPIGERLRRVRRFVEDEAMFLANYADVLTNAPLPDMIERFEASERGGQPARGAAAVVAPRRRHRRRRADHPGDADAGPAAVGERRLLRAPARDLRLPRTRARTWSRTRSARLVPQGRVLAYPYKGYWSPADTVKERVQLEEMYHRGNCPWMIWDPERSGADARADAVTASSRGTSVAAGIRAARSVLRMLPCTCAASGGRCPCSPSAHTPTTSRSAPAGRCSASRRASRGCRSATSC